MFAIQFIGRQYQDDLMDIEEDITDALQKDLKKSHETVGKYSTLFVATFANFFFFVILLLYSTITLI